MTDLNNKIRISSIDFPEGKRFLQNKAGFDRALSSGAINKADGNRVAFAVVIPAWVLYVGGAACITGGAYALDNLRKILCGEPRTKGTPAQEGLVRQMMRSIRGDSRFSTLPVDMQAHANTHIMKMDDGNPGSDKKGSTDSVSSVSSSGAPLPPDDEKEKIEKEIEQLKKDQTRLKAEVEAQEPLAAKQKGIRAKNDPESAKGKLIRLKKQLQGINGQLKQQEQN